MHVSSYAKLVMPMAITNKCKLYTRDTIYLFIKLQEDLFRMDSILSYLIFNKWVNKWINT